MSTFGRFPREDIPHPGHGQDGERGQGEEADRSLSPGDREVIHHGSEIALLRDLYLRRSG